MALASCLTCLSCTFTMFTKTDRVKDGGLSLQPSYIPAYDRSMQSRKEQWRNNHSPARLYLLHKGHLARKMEVEEWRSTHTLCTVMRWISVHVVQSCVPDWSWFICLLVFIFFLLLDLQHLTKSLRFASVNWWQNNYRFFITHNP